MNRFRSAASILAATLVLTACSASSPASSPTVASAIPGATSAPASATASPSVQASVAASPSPAPTTFTSKTYGYSLTVPGGWTSVQATAKWDGKGAPFHDVPEADQFISTAAASAWLFAAPTTKTLAARVDEMIAANVAEHGNTCPPVPEIRDPIEIGGQPATLVGYNCGILINSAVTIHNGVAYVFGFRDPAVHAASDPADRAVFLELLKSVRFPD